MYSVFSIHFTISSILSASIYCRQHKTWPYLILFNIPIPASVKNNENIFQYSNTVSTVYLPCTSTKCSESFSWQGTCLFRWIYRSRFYQKFIIPKSYTFRYDWLSCFIRPMFGKTIKEVKSFKSAEHKLNQNIYSTLCPYKMDGMKT